MVEIPGEKLIDAEGANWVAEGADYRDGIEYWIFFALFPFWIRGWTAPSMQVPSPRDSPAIMA